MRSIGQGSAMFVALALFAAACSSSAARSSAPNPTSTTAATTATSTTPTTTGTGTARLSGFRSCMESHGVTLPQRNRTDTSTPTTAGTTPGSGGASRFLQPPAGVDPAKYQDALDACRAQIPARGNGNGGQAGEAAAGGHAVVYKVTGSARSASVVYTDGGGANDASVALPYQMAVRLDSGVFFSLVATAPTGALTCETIVDDKSIVTDTAPVGTAADCHGTVPG